MPWDQQDLNALGLLHAALGPIQVISVEENGMNDQAEEELAKMDMMETGGSGWGDGFQGDEPRFPEYPYSLADHVYTYSPKLPDGAMLVIRAQRADELVAQVEALAPLAGRLVAAWRSVSGTAAPAPQGPMQSPQTGPPFGLNVSVPQAPGYVGPPVQSAPHWGAPASVPPMSPTQANRQGPKPRPDWPMVYKVNVPFPQKDAFKAFREQNKEVLRGKVAWAGGGDYWVHGDVVGGFTAYNPVAA